MLTFNDHVLIDEPTNTLAVEHELPNGDVEIEVRTITDQDLYDLVVDASVG